MATEPVQVLPMVTTTIRAGGNAVDAAFGPMLAGLIQNPFEASDQGITIPEPIFVDLINEAVLQETNTCKRVNPGEMVRIPDGFTGRVSVNAASSGHRFAGIVVQPFNVFVPFDGAWPPTTYTTLTNVIKSYLYQQYTDDDNLQVFVNSFNDMTQEYITWFATVMLPVYTNPMVSGALLDWVGEGLYGIKRPALPNGQTQNLGMFNTYMFNTFQFNDEEIVGPQSYYFTDDDTYRRVITWHLWKGDGKIFNIRWLKRRIERFLTGMNGGPGDTDQTYNISISFGVGNQVNINIQTIKRFATGGAVFGAGMFNTFQFNEYETYAVHLPSNPMVPILKAAIDSGVLELPFQYTYVVNVN